MRRTGRLGRMDGPWNANIHYDTRLAACVPAAAEAVLDVGCGDGFLAARLARRVPFVVAIDRDAPVLGRARARFPEAPVTWCHGDAGWHIESSYREDDQWRVNVGSRERGLLAIFLLTDAGADSARPGCAPAATWTCPRSWPPGTPETCSCAIRSWFTRHHGRTGAGSRG